MTMKLKHFKEGVTDSGGKLYFEIDRVWVIGFCDDSDDIFFEEGCDNYFHVKMPKSEAIRELRLLADKLEQNKGDL